MKIHKFNTRVVKITHKNATSVHYILYTDVDSRSYTHRIPRSAAFPYKRLEIGLCYTLICAQLDVDGQPEWFFWRAWQLDQVEDGAFVDEQLEKLIADQPGSIDG